MKEVGVPYFNKEITSTLKAIFLILMFILHFFCFPSWYVDGISYPKLAFLESMQGHFQICVAGFAVLTGYFYAFHEPKTFRYSWHKILDVMIPYWVSFILFLILALITRTYSGSMQTVVLGFFALEYSVMPFCWYILFYIIAMLSFPLLVRLCRGKLLFVMSVGILGPIVLYMVVSRFVEGGVLLSTLEKYQVYFPIMIAGYAAAEWNLFERLDSLIKQFPKVIKCFLMVIVLILIFTEPGWLYSIPLNGIVFSAIRKLVRIVSIPLFLYALVNLLKPLEKKRILKPLQKIGKQSLPMWFSHCLFFGCSASVFQKFLYWPKIPLFVLLWGLLLNYCAALAISTIAKLLKNTLSREQN